MPCCMGPVATGAGEALARTGWYRRRTCVSETRSNSNCFLKAVEQTDLDEAVVPAVTEFETPSLGA